MIRRRESYGQDTLLVSSLYSQDHKNLLEILLSLMKNEMSQSMRRLTMKVLGTLGALDPYAHKVR